MPSNPRTPRTPRSKGTTEKVVPFPRSTTDDADVLAQADRDPERDDAAILHDADVAPDPAPAPTRRSWSDPSLTEASCRERAHRYSLERREWTWAVVKREGTPPKGQPSAYDVVLLPHRPWDGESGPWAAWRRTAVVRYAHGEEVPS